MSKLEHPLFPAKDEGDDPPEIGNISISRFNPVTGRSPFVPRMFSAEEIRDLSQIAALFGGGTYELTGRNVEGNRIVAKRVYEIAGDSKPLVAELPTPAVPQPVTGGYQSPAQGALPSQLAGYAPILGVIVPVVLQYMQNAAADRREQQAQTQANNLMMMQQQQASSQAFIQAMSNLHPRGGNGSEDFRAGIAFAENIIAGKAEAAEGNGETDTAEIMKTMGQAFEMMKLTGGETPPTNGAT